MFDDLSSQVYVQIRPIKMIRMLFLYIQNFSRRGILEPREILVRHKQLFIVASSHTPLPEMWVTSTRVRFCPSALELLIMHPNDIFDSLYNYPLES